MNEGRLVADIVIADAQSHHEKIRAQRPRMVEV
jgi:hypothetical protein